MQSVVEGNTLVRTTSSPPPSCGWSPSPNKFEEEVEGFKRQHPPQGIQLVPHGFAFAFHELSDRAAEVGVGEEMG